MMPRPLRTMIWVMSAATVLMFWALCAGLGVAIHWQIIIPLGQGVAAALLMTGMLRDLSGTQSDSLSSND